MIQSLLRIAHAIEQFTAESARAGGHVPAKIDNIGDNQFGGRARCRRAKIGHEIGNSEIDFMPNSGDDRNGHISDRARDDLFVELPQIFHASAAARDHDKVDSRKIFVRLCQLANRRCAWRGDDSDSLRKFWERTFSGRIEKSLGIEFAFERIELRLQNADPARLNDLDAELVLAARFEYRDISVNLHMCAVGERLAQRRHRVSKNYAGDLGPRIFEGEVLMTAWMQFVIRNFALHPNRAEFRFESATNAARQL